MAIGLRRQTQRKEVAGRSHYATAEEFENLFESERKPLLRLALLLTASAEKAEQSLNLALKDCRLNGSVSTDWIISWARRAIVRTAIELVPRPVSAAAAQTVINNYHHCSTQVSAAVALQIDVPMILQMPDFERFVFVTTVLERISIHDCALLLARSPKDVCDAQTRAMRTSLFAQHDLNASFDVNSAERNTCGKAFEN